MGIAPSNQFQQWIKLFGGQLVDDEVLDVLINNAGIMATPLGYMPYALNADHAEQLWTIAEKLVEL
jgi:NAD(P)-dependent dehydrogenase (short-subunit alcohol dehydrogenase family)